MDDGPITTSNSAFVHGTRLSPARLDLDTDSNTVRSFRPFVQHTIHATRRHLPNLDSQPRNSDQTPTRRLFRQDIPNDASLSTLLCLFQIIRSKRDSMSRFYRHDPLHGRPQLDSSVDEP